MSMNYYAHIKPCPTCHRSDEVIHLGKLSSGWRFLAHGQKEFSNWNEFREFVRRHDIAIWSIYEQISSQQLLEEIERSSDGNRHENGKSSGPIDIVFEEFS